MTRFTLLLLSAMAAVGVHARLIALPGTTPQSTPAYTTFPNDLRVQAQDALGRPVPGAVITFTYPSTVISGTESTQGCVFELGYYCQRAADQDGLLVLAAPRALSVGTTGVFFEYGGDTLRVELTVTPAVTAPTVHVLGADQAIALGRESQPIGLQVLRAGVPVAGLRVTFYVDTNRTETVPTAPGTFGQVSAITDASGVAMMGTLRAVRGLGPGLVIAHGIDQESGVGINRQIAFLQTDAVGSTAFDAQHLWWGGASESGWGVSIAQHGNRLFNVVFAYDEAGRPTWLAMTEGGWIGGVGNKYNGPLFLPTGSPYYAYDPARLNASRIAALGTVEFDDARHARLRVEYRGFGSPWPTRVTPIERFDFSPAMPSPERGVTDIWWGGPSQNGWGLSITEQAGNLFAAWFTYDAEGRATWFALPAGEWVDAMTWTGSVYRNTSSGWIAGFFDPASVRQERVGSATLRFVDASHARFTYDVEGHRGSLPIQRFDY
jgi:hypothetical protein